MDYCACPQTLTHARTQTNTNLHNARFIQHTFGKCSCITLTFLTVPVLKSHALHSHGHLRKATGRTSGLRSEAPELELIRIYGKHRRYNYVFSNTNVSFFLTRTKHEALKPPHMLIFSSIFQRQKLFVKTFLGKVRADYTFVFHASL